MQLTQNKEVTQPKKVNQHTPPTYLDIAVKILERENKPLHVNKIAEIMLLEKLVSPFASRTLQTTLRSKLSQDIKNNPEETQIKQVAPSTYSFNLAKQLLKPIPIEPTKESLLRDYVLKLTPTWLYACISRYLQTFQRDKLIVILDTMLQFLRTNDSKFPTTIYQTSVKIIDNSINMNDLAIICRYYSINNDKMLNLVVDKLMESEDFIEFIENYKENNK